MLLGWISRDFAFIPAFLGALGDAGKEKGRNSGSHFPSPERQIENSLAASQIWDDPNGIPGYFHPSSIPWISGLSMKCGMNPNPFPDPEVLPVPIPWCCSHYIFWELPNY